MEKGAIAKSSFPRLSVNDTYEGFGVFLNRLSAYFARGSETHCTENHEKFAKFKGKEFRSAVCYCPERSAHVILTFGTGQSWPPGRMPLGMDMLRMLEKMINPSIDDITCAGAIHREFSYDFYGLHMILYGFHMVFVIFKACGANWECSTITESNIVELANAISKDGAISRFAKGSQ